jgi:hypothetical protein
VVGAPREIAVGGDELVATMSVGAMFVWVVDMATLSEAADPPGGGDVAAIAMMVASVRATIINSNRIDVHLLNTLPRCSRIPATSFDKPLPSGYNRGQAAFFVPAIRAHRLSGGRCVLAK